MPPKASVIQRLNLCYFIINLLYQLNECLHSFAAYAYVFWIFNLANDLKTGFCIVQKYFAKSKQKSNLSSLDSML